MTDAALTRAVSRALLALRITLGISLLQWGLEKFIAPRSVVAVWGHFYGIDIWRGMAYLLGTLETAIAVCLLLGVLRTPAYAAALTLQAFTVLVSWRMLVDPWGDPLNHLFIASVPVLGATVALFLLRRWDRGVAWGKQSRE